MTMQTPHSPKPKIFGDGYGKHVSHNYQLMKKFFGLGLKLLANMFIPGIFYERAHWEVIELYYKMQGYRHGTNNAKRCDECGADLLSSNDKVLEKSTLDPTSELTDQSPSSDPENQIHKEN